MIAELGSNVSSTNLLTSSLSAFAKLAGAAAVNAVIAGSFFGGNAAAFAAGATTVAGALFGKKGAVITSVATIGLGLTNLIGAVIIGLANLIKNFKSTPALPPSEPLDASTNNQRIQQEIREWHSNIHEKWKNSPPPEFEKLIQQGQSLGCLNEPPPLGVLENRRIDPIFLQIAKVAPHNFSEQAKTLITAGADLKMQCSLGNTPLMWAIANAKNGFADTLIEYGPGYDYIDMISHVKNADEDRFAGFGTAAIHIAVGKGYVDISKDGDLLPVTNLQLVTKMIDKGCQVNIFDSNRNTPLHYACIRRDIKMIEALLKGGANPELVNQQGQIPADLLNLGFDAARSNLEDLVSSMFLLDQAEYEKNLIPCRQLLQA